MTIPPIYKVEMKIQASKILLKLCTQNIEDPTHTQLKFDDLPNTMHPSLAVANPKIDLQGYGL
jgi:hypothetical protein